MQVVRVYIARAFLGAFTTPDGLCNSLVQLTHALLDRCLPQGHLTQIMPRSKIEMLALAEFGYSRGALALETLVRPSRHFDEVNRSDAAEAVQMADFVFEVLDKFPLAILASQIRGGQAREQQV